MTRRRSSSRRRPSFAATVIILVVLGAIVGAQQLFGWFGGDTPAAPTPEPEVFVSDSGSWYQLYFTSPIYPDEAATRPSASVADPVIQSIANAIRTVDAVTYEFNLPQMAEALIDAHRRGLVVRLVTDTDSEAEEEVHRIEEAGIPVVFDNRSAIMHDKFVIVDSATVWTGSWNFTHNDTYRNNNNIIGLTSTRAVANYQTEFDEMFERGEFGPTSTANTPYPQFTVNGVLVENYFSAEDGVAQHVLRALEGAQSSIYFAAFSFTREDFSQTLIDKANAGVTVKGVYESRQVGAGANQSYDLLAAAKLPVLLDGHPYTMHHKFFVIDEAIVVTGSYNFSNSAERSNDENVLIFHSPDIARLYVQEFLKVWGQAGGN